MADERYWRNGRGYWRSGTNANGLDMQDCDLLHQQENEGRPLERKDLEKVDRYTLSDIARWARQECVAALQGQGRGRGYTFAGRLAHYAEQDRFRADVAKIGALPKIPEPSPDRDSSLFDRVDAYNAHVRYATRDIRNKAERSREGESSVPSHGPQEGSARHRRERSPEAERDPSRCGDATETPVQAPRGLAGSPQRSAREEPCGARAEGVAPRRSRKRVPGPEL